MYIFVEGTFDKLLVSNLTNIEDYEIVEYSSMKYKKVNSYIATLKQQGIDYIFMFDTDGKSKKDKLNQKLAQYKQLDKNKCSAVIVEIEGWYMAGCSDEILKKYKIKQKNNTNNYNKENMEQDFKTNKLYSFYKEILDSFSIQDALDKNLSFKEFYSKYQSIFLNKH